MVGGRDRDRTGDPLLAKHATPLQQLYQLFLTTNVSNKSGNLLSAQSYPQWRENVGFLHSPYTATADRNPGSEPLVETKVCITLSVDEGNRRRCISRPLFGADSLFELRRRTVA